MASATITSTVTILDQCSRLSYQASWSGSTPVGTLAVQFSNDYSVFPDGTVNNSGSWTTATLSVAGSPASSVAVSGNTGTSFIDVWETSAYAVRLVYTKGSGTGTLNASIKAGVL